jgi:hypothetical protein
MNHLPFQNVLRGDGVELRLDEGGIASSTFGELAWVERGPDQERALERIFERRRRLLSR